MRRVLRGRGRHEHERRIARRQLDVRGRGLPHQRADHVRVRRPRARVLELGERGDERQLRGWCRRGCNPKRGRPSARAGVVELGAPELQAVLERPAGPAPERATDRRPRQPRAERVDRQAGLALREDVGDQRRAGNALELRRERGGEREDVGDDDVGLAALRPAAACRAWRGRRPRRSPAAPAPEGNTWYSGAAANVKPSASIGARQRSHVCTVTSCPRAASARPRAIIGNACPGSPKAPSSTRSEGLTGDTGRRDRLRARYGEPRDVSQKSAQLAPAPI